MSAQTIFDLVTPALILDRPRLEANAARMREKVAALGVCGSAAMYVLSYAAVSVGSDFRYAYWAVLAGMAGGVVAALPEGERMSDRELVPRGGIEPPTP